MKIRIVFAVALTFLARPALCDEARVFRSSDRLVLGADANLSASVRVADVDQDNDLDVIVANGRHWPQQNFVLMNQGQARFNVQRSLGDQRSTSYATEVADLDGDGDLDIAVGNDMAPNRIFLNDRSGHFVAGPEFGTISSLRSLTLADVDSDGDVDILATSRRKPNQIYFNDGSYMSTPVVYGDSLYLGNTNGVIRCFNARTGEKIYEKRLGGGASIIASLVAADGKIYCASENGTVYVLAAGPEFKILARNEMGQPCFATPAISQGVIYIRTTKRLLAIKANP